jgi:hypothetical protein
LYNALLPFVNAILLTEHEDLGIVFLKVMRDLRGVEAVK